MIEIQTTDDLDTYLDSIVSIARDMLGEPERITRPERMGNHHAKLEGEWFVVEGPSWRIVLVSFEDDETKFIPELSVDLSIPAHVRVVEIDEFIARAKKLRERFSGIERELARHAAVLDPWHLQKGEEIPTGLTPVDSAPIFTLLASKSRELAERLGGGGYVYGDPSKPCGCGVEGPGFVSGEVLVFADVEIPCGSDLPF